MLCKRNGIIKANPSGIWCTTIAIKKEWQSHYDL